MEVIEAIKTRRSIRKWTNQPVPDELIEKIVDAARWAPSVHNFQPVECIVIRDQKTKDQLSQWTIEGHAKSIEGWSHEDMLDKLKTLPEHVRQDENVVKKQYGTFYKFLAQCPVIIGVMAYTKAPMKERGKPSTHEGYNRFHLMDTYMSIQNMLLAAHGLGLGGVIITRTIGDHREKVSKLLGVPEDYFFHALVCVGYAAEKPVVEKKSVEQYRHYEMFGQKTKPGK